MTRRTTASDWAGARGRKWLAELAEMERMLAPVDDPLLEALRLEAPCRIAEIGCGGGSTTLATLRRAPAGSVVHGFDISPELIAAARARIPSGEAAPTFEVADVGRAAAPCEPYDRLSSRFGVMFFDDPGAAFRRLRDWLVPGGRLAFAVWGPPRENAWEGVVRDVVQDLVDLPVGTPGGPGLFRYADARALLDVLARAGFADLEAVTWRGDLPVGGDLSPADAAGFALASFSSFAEALRAAGERPAVEARRVLTERFAGHWRDGAVRLAASVHLVTGARGA